MTIRGCNIDLNDLFEIKLIFYDPSRIMNLSEFEWTPCSSVYVVFNNFVLLDATERSKISSDQKRLFSLHFSRTLPFIKIVSDCSSQLINMVNLSI